MHGHLTDLFQRESRRIPCFHSADQVTGELRVTGANEQPHDSLEIVIAFEHEKNRFFRIEHPARPDGENGRAANVQRAGDVTAAERKHCSCVNEHTGLLLDRFLKRFGWKTGNAWQDFPELSGPFAFTFFMTG